MKSEYTANIELESSKSTQSLMKERKPLDFKKDNEKDSTNFSDINDPKTWGLLPKE